MASDSVVENRTAAFPAAAPATERLFGQSVRRSETATSCKQDRTIYYLLIQYYISSTNKRCFACFGRPVFGTLYWL